MSKSVMISIKPHWCELIASGKKTVEVRKTRPKLKTPFKCYIYETMNARFSTDIMGKQYFRGFDGRGKIIGEFVCERIEDYSKWEHDIPSLYRHINLFACIDFPELYDYLPNGGGYGWHISKLVIYDEPKELREFMQCHKCEYYSGCKEHEYGCDGIYKVKRPPQSWCYVEDIL